MINLIPPLITAVLDLNVIVFLVLSQNEEKGRLLPLGIATLWWHITMFSLFLVSDYETANLIGVVGHIGIFYIPVGMFWVFRPYFRSKWVLPAAHTFYGIILFFLFFSDLVIRGTKKLEFGFYPLAGPLHPLFIVLVMVCVSSCARVAYLQRQRSASALERKHLLFLIWMLFIYSGVSVDLLQNYELATFYPFGAIFSSIFLIAVVYAIVRYSLFQSRIVTSQQIAKTVASTAQMIAHDIQAPFNMLRAILHDVKEIPFVREKIERHIDRVELSQTYVAEVLQDLLIFGSERMNQLGELDLKAIFSECWARLQALHRDEIQMDTSMVKLNTAVADSAKMKRLFSNLLVNAIEAIRGGGGGTERVWLASQLRVKDKVAFVEVVVGNSGTFIAEGDLADIFVKFHTKGKTSGSGLGLLVVQEVVHSHGGEIFCRSDRKAGTEFVFTLPVSKSGAERT